MAEEKAITDKAWELLEYVGIADVAHERARKVLTEHMESLHRLSKILLDRETYHELRGFNEIYRVARFGIDCGEVATRYGAEGNGPSIYFDDPEGNKVELKGPPG